LSECGKKIVHDYVHVDYDIVWGVVTADLPPLIEQLKAILPDETASQS
jgi:uncharacterized protein with HEPN domain